ncbi:MAG: hypothetical protein U9Q71_08205 [Pseudomonadota bacterium]|nr:hypothetical protein [Pseudomonadota bacterium]
MLLVIALGIWVVPLYADDFAIGYLELKGDHRYDKKRTFARYLTQALGRPRAGAEVALGEVKFHGAELGVNFKLDFREGADLKTLIAAVDELAGGGVSANERADPLKNKAFLLKKEQLEQIGVNTLVTACANCRDTLEIGLENNEMLDIEVLGITELIAESLAASGE